MLVKHRGKLYIEFGGKLIQDKHSARVLPGYDEDAKFKLARQLCAHGEAIFVVSSRDIARGRVRGDFGTRYDKEALRTLDELATRGLRVRFVAISMLQRNIPVPRRIIHLESQLKKRGISPFRFYEIIAYVPKKEIVYELAENPFIKIRSKLVLIISPGGGSGKFGICLNQLYHEMARGNAPSYLKFETFPVHDLPITHTLNLAYMAASADFYDIVMRDKRHGKATSYKRDIDNYELLRTVARTFGKEGRYLRTLTSATHMGANMLSRGIIDDEVIQKEAAAEIARRLVRYKFEVQEKKEDPRVLERVRTILAML